MQPPPSFLWVWQHQVHWTKASRDAARASVRAAALRNRTLLPPRPDDDEGAAGAECWTYLCESADFTQYHGSYPFRWSSQGYRDIDTEVEAQIVLKPVARLVLSPENSIKLVFLDAYNFEYVRPGREGTDIPPWTLVEVVYNRRYRHYVDHELCDWKYCQNRVRLLWAANDNASWEKLCHAEPERKCRHTKALW